MSDRVKTTITDGVADVRLVRTDKMNALDNAMIDALIETSTQLEADTSVRCVVISGEGRAFCAGLDMGSFAQMADGGSGGVTRGRLAERTHGVVNRPQKSVWGWRELRVPVIAAVHGVALGGGLQVMLGSDIRIVHPETKLSILEVKWGLVPDMSSTAIMRQLAREDIIRELTYTGRMFSGVEAVEYGFATRTSETPLEEALALAKEIASRSPSAVQTAKKLYNDLPDRDDAAAILAESEAQDSLIGSPNQLEAVMAGMEKRDGVFEDA
ncbi:MAG: crotonase/enoyl-CoA hydratase family protein [Pseudomonadota bacterium]